MSATDEIMELEERLRLAELGPDPAVFEELLADEALLDGEQAKARVVAAHQPDSSAPKFTRVEMRDCKVIDHGEAAVVTCTGTYEGSHGTFTLHFMRVWLKKDGRWQIIAGTVSKG